MKGASGIGAGQSAAEIVKRVLALRTDDVKLVEASTVIGGLDQEPAGLQVSLAWSTCSAPCTLEPGSHPTDPARRALAVRLSCSRRWRPSACCSRPAVHRHAMSSVAQRAPALAHYCVCAGSRQGDVETRGAHALMPKRAPRALKLSRTTSVSVGTHAAIDRGETRHCQQCVRGKVCGCACIVCSCVGFRGWDGLWKAQN